MNLSKLIRKINYYGRYITDRVMPEPAPGVNVDIIIPVTAKDLDILPLALEGVKRCVSHNIAAIYVLAADGERVKSFCRNNGLIFVEETSVLGYGPCDMNLMVGQPPINRSGWLFQQLLKLSGNVGMSPYFITMDADHVLLHPHTFVAAEGRRMCMYQSKEYHKPYYDNIKRLIGRDVKAPLSYVAHKMVFERRSLVWLRQVIEEHNPGLRWDEAIIKSISPDEVSGFSEFELYGNFIASTGKIDLLFRNHHLPASAIQSYDNLLKIYGAKFRSVTFPDYLH